MNVDVLDWVGALGVVPVVELRSVKHAGPLLEALASGGLDVAEITLRTEAGLEAIHLLRAAYPQALVGAGTVRTTADAKRVIDAGAQFIASPATNPELIELCCSLGVVVTPGACTPTEVDAVLRSGANAVKFFPAEAAGGIPFLKALAGRFRDARFVPTGGIDASNLADYLRAWRSWARVGGLVGRRARRTATASTKNSAGDGSGMLSAWVFCATCGGAAASWRSTSAPRTRSCTCAGRGSSCSSRR